MSLLDHCILETANHSTMPAAVSVPVFFLHGKRGTDRTDGTCRIRDCYIYMSDVTLGRYFTIVLYAGEAARSHQERVASSVTVFLIVLAELIRNPHLVLLLCA